jgi:hypothetical protein
MFHNGPLVLLVAQITKKTVAQPTKILKKRVIFGIFECFWKPVHLVHQKSFCIFGGTMLYILVMIYL